MSMPKIKFERRGKNIIDIRSDADRTVKVGDDEEIMPKLADFNGKSINAAKRKSRELQAKYGALTVRAVS